MYSVKIINASLSYPVFDSRLATIRSAFMDRIRVGGSINRDRDSVLRVHALNDINIEVKEGERVGLLGVNGAGKSTLLRLISGIYEPQSGEIQVSGRISSVFNLRVGIDLSATGYENIRLVSLLNGINVHPASDILRDVEEFSELGDFLNLPVRTYSQGMTMRLVFSIVTSIDPDILILDEWIGTGDRDFMAKAKNRLVDMTRSAKITLLASHSTALLKSVCNRGIVLDEGRILVDDTMESAIDKYTATNPKN